MVAATEPMTELTRRDVLLAGGLTALLAGCDIRPDAPQSAVRADMADIFVPGYAPDQAHFGGVPMLDHPRLRRAIPRGYKGNITLLTRFRGDGEVRQALFPVRGHDIAISPDKNLGIFGAMEGPDYVAFDPGTLDLVARGRPFREGWIGGGHAAFLNRGLVALTERAPKQPFSGQPTDHFGHVSLREPGTMKIVGGFSTHGISPHEIRLLEDGIHAVIANYGSTVARGGGKEYGVPRHIVEASLTIVDIRSGKLVEKYLGGPKEELRHLCARDRETIFAIQAKLARRENLPSSYGRADPAHGPAPRTEEGAGWAVAPTMRVRPGGGGLEAMGRPADRGLMRQGLSIEYDPHHDEVIASYPSSHTVLVFDAASGEKKHRIACDRIGLHYPCGLALLPGQNHYVVAGYWRNLFVFERGTHRLLRELCHFPVNYGHSHIVAA